LTERQKQVLRVVYRVSEEQGRPPTVREIGKEIGLSSTCTVQRHLEALVRKGYIKREAARARAITIIKSDDPRMLPRRTVKLPLVGTVAAGKPLLAAENIEEVFPLPRDLVKDAQAFMLRVQGDSMIEAGIFDGDLAVVRQQNYAEDGDIVVALLEEEATVKRFRRRRGRLFLEPANAMMKPLRAEGATILGKVIMTIRQFT
jgi:repressor LexA